MWERLGKEMACIDLGDRRLNNRAIKVIETLQATPEASINASFFVRFCAGESGWIEAVRFFIARKNPLESRGATV